MEKHNTGANGGVTMQFPSPVEAQKPYSAETPVSQLEVPVSEKGDDGQETSATPVSAIASSNDDTDKVAVVQEQYPPDYAQPMQQPVYPAGDGSPVPPQQYAYQQPYPDQQQQSAGHQFKTAIPLTCLQRRGAPVDCPACGHRAMTATKYSTGNTTHAWAAGVCILTCLGCIPYCINGTKNVEHRCGKCGVFLATWHRSGDTEVHLHA